jgi:hypothetical protein
LESFFLSFGGKVSAAILREKEAIINDKNKARNCMNFILILTGVDGITNYSQKK